MPPSSLSTAAPTHRDSIEQQILAAQVKLLYGNANAGVWATLVVAPLLGRLQWGVTPHPVILGWCLYMIVVAVARFALASRYRRTVPPNLKTTNWGDAFAVGAGLAGLGWGAAGVLLYPETQLANQVFLAFVLGGMILGAASLLAPLPEAFVAFIVPSGLALALRLVIQEGETHFAMGLLVGLFTLATLITTRRIYLTIVSSLKLQFENQELVANLRAAKNHADTLNEQLEIRVQERTAELQRSAERLRAEITQREQMEEELLRAQKLESLGVLAGGIAHDFNNFLAVIQGNVEVAKMSLDPQEPAQEILDQTASACRRAAFLSSQLLTFAKGGDPVRRVVSIASLVTDAVQLARAGAQTRIEVSISEDLRSAEVDPSQIGQVLHNILLNARQAMPEGGNIEVRAENVVLSGSPEAATSVRISIRDYGCGIPAAILPRIFDPYFTTKAGGSGLGLATAHAIVVKHGGTLSVESKPGDGAVFTIDLPASEESSEPQAPMVDRTQAGSERLLVMDDEEPLRRLLDRVLTKLGYEVQTARDGAEAIALCESAKAAGRPFAAALLDLTVSGGMGGFEAAARLKEVDSSLRLIVSSGYSDAPVMSEFRKYGFDEMVAKPWGTAELSDVFRRVLAPDPNCKAG